MRIICIIVIILSITTINSNAQTNKDVKEFKKIKVSTEWIKQLKSYDFKTNNATLIKNFEKIIKPDTLILPYNGNPRVDGGILNPIFVNLDDNEPEEVIALIGWTRDNPMLTVFKQIDNQWYLIFTESFYVHYSPPELNIANVPSKNKTFYIRWLHERGTGIFRDSYHFYKLINNKVIQCLEIVNNAEIFGWGLYLNQKVQSSFKFSSTTTDEIWITYNYNFYPGAVYNSDSPWDGHPDIPFIKGKQSINYKWDSLMNSYKPHFYNQKDDLTKQKLASFEIFGNDSLFITAFKYEIKQTLEKGTEEQKKLLTNYIKIIKLDKNHSTLGKVEQKAQIGNLKFYGIKKKK